MTKQVAYTCKFCGKNATAKYDAEFVHQLSEWVPLLSCDRCADFQHKRIRLADAIQAKATLVNSARMTLLHKPDTLAQMLAELERVIAVKTKEYAQLVCNHHRVSVTWDPDFVAQIMAMPQKATMICTAYERGMRSGKFVAPKQNERSFWYQER